MSESRLQPLCEACGRPVDPDAADVVKAMPAMAIETMGMSGWIEGMGVYLHEDCFPLGSGEFGLVGS